jgi:hypothetical protein
VSGNPTTEVVVNLLRPGFGQDNPSKDQLLPEQTAWRTKN